MAPQPEHSDGSPRRPEARGRVASVIHHPVTLTLGMATAYFALSLLGLWLIDDATSVAVVWPASGVALATFCMNDRRRWVPLALGIVIGNFAAQMLGRAALAPSLLLCGVNALEPIIAATVLLKIARVRTVQTVLTREVAGLAAAATVGNAPTAMLGALVVHLFFGAPFLSAATTWLLADGMGMLVVAPFLLSRAPLRNWTPSERRRAGSLIAAQSALTTAVFWLPPTAGSLFLQYPIALVPLLLAIAFIGRPEATGLGILLTGMIATLATSRGVGPFARDDATSLTHLLALQEFLAAIIVSTLMVGAVVGQRRRAEAQAANSARRLSGVLSAATEYSVIGTDVDGIIEVFNEGAERMLGHRADDVIGTQTPAIIHDPDEVVARAQELGLDPGFEVFVHAARRGDAETRDWTYIRADGGRLTVSLTVTAVRDDRGGIVGFIGIAHDITEQRAAERRLLESEARHRALIDRLPDALVILYDRDLRCVLAEGPLIAASGFDRASLIGRTLAEVAPESAPMLEPPIRRALAGVPTAMPFESPTSGRSYDVDVIPFVGTAGAVEGTYVVMRDRTAKHEQERKTRQAEADLRSIFQSAPIGQAVLDGSGRIIDVNQTFCAITGYGRDRLIGAPIGHCAHPDDLERVYEQFAHLAVNHDETLQFEQRAIHAAGHPVVLNVHATLLTNVDGATRTLIQMIDVTERKRIEERLLHLADHDPLTGLLNRRRFEEELERHVAFTRRYGADGAVIVLDIDYFKQINDTFGHAVGDEVIVQVANVLLEQLRTTDFLARLGGDEFAILLPAAKRADAELVAGRLVAAVRACSAEASEQHSRHPLTVSVGVAMIGPERDLTAEGVLVDADMAMYDAKEAGRDRFSVFAPDQRSTTRDAARNTWVDRIHAALEGNQLEVLAQPIEDLRTGTTVQHELLLRMPDDHGDLMPPAVFLYLAERYGLIGQVDRWVANRAIRTLSVLQRSSFPGAISINLSRSALGDRGLLDEIERELASAGVTPANLIIEVSEAAAVADISRASAFADRLAAIGCRFALDDFGAGYGSFYHLKRLTSDFLKIDRSFVEGCATNESDRLVIESIVDLARGMQRQTIAECVDDAETKQLLIGIGVDLAQGFHIADPVALEVAFPELGVPASRR